MDENKLMFWVVLFCAVLSVAYFVRVSNTPTQISGQQPSVKSSEVGKTKEDLTLANDCGQVTTSCVVEVKIKAKKCKIKSVKAEAEQLLHEPLANPGCQGIQDKLTAMCSKGCQVDPVSLLMIPGKVEYKILDQPDSVGDCMIAAEKGVSLRMNCILSGEQ